MLSRSNPSKSRKGFIVIASPSSILGLLIARTQVFQNAYENVRRLTIDKVTSSIKVNTSCKASCSKVSIISPQFTSLPREIRDIVYQYALCDTDIYLLFHKGKLCLQDSPFDGFSREVNQLKYVSRQIYAETYGVEIRNAILFEDSSEQPGAIKQCASFLKTCSRAERAQIRGISLKTIAHNFDKEVADSNLTVILGFCKDHPETLVKLHLPYWSQGQANFMLVALSLLATVRGDKQVFAKLTSESCADRFLDLLLSTDDQERVSHSSGRPPVNFRIFPAEELFHEATFLESCERSEFVQTNMSDLTKWKKLAVTIFNHGI
jgi:hypothetical protein